jgi:tetratricopeptide (TPR) repeat protein
LASIDGVTFSSEAAKDNIKGQALFLRAWSYFNLVQFFGKVPMHLTPVTTLEGTAAPLAEVADIHTQIIADVSDAIDLLPLKSAQEVGRITNGAAKMLLANVYMVQKNYPQAETLLKDIIDDGQYSLMASYAGVFDPNNKNNAESIFEIQYRAGSDGYSSLFIYGMLPHPMSADTLGKLTGVTNPQSLTNAEGYNIPSPDIIEAYEPGDLRFGVTIDSTYDISGKKFPFCRKYLHPHTQFQQSNDNWPVYRYAEVLLFLAEAVNEQGRYAEALTYINDPVGTSPISIRERAGLADILALNKEDARVAIEHERRIELAFENKRWLDLVRTDRAVSVMTAYGVKIRADEAGYYIPAGYHLSIDAFAAIDLVWPLPADEALYSPYF